MTTTNIRALLIVIEPGGTERVIEITQSRFSIGRSSAKDLSLKDPQEFISGSHAELVFENERISLNDLSTNGTFVGQHPIGKNKSYPIAYGETFTIGPYRLRLAPAPHAAVSQAVTPAGVRPIPAAAGSSPPSPPSPAALPPAGQPPLPAAPPPAGQPPSSADAMLGLPIDGSRYLQYLPPIYQEHDFLGDFLLAFEGVWAPIEQVIDNFDLYLDPATTPEFFLGQLAAWLGVMLDENWPPARRRTLIGAAAELYRRRGTRWALSRCLEIYAGVKPEIFDELADRPHHFRVVLRVAPDRAIDPATLERLIQACKPAHTTFECRVETVRTEAKTGAP